MIDSLDTSEAEARPWVNPTQPAPGEEGAPALTKEETALGAFLAAMHDSNLDGGKMREAMLNVLGLTATHQPAAIDAEQAKGREAAIPTDQQILNACEEAGLWPNTAASWVQNGAFRRYHEAINRMCGIRPQPQADETMGQMAERLASKGWQAVVCCACGSEMAVGYPKPPVGVPDEVMRALNRMLQPLHESRLSGVTAAEDVRCMKIIMDHVLSAASQPASQTQEIERRVAELESELSVSNNLLQHREQLLNAIPDCPVHGSGCVSHALEWIEKAKLVMQSEITTLPNDQERSMTADEAVKMAAHGLLAFADRNGVVLTIERTPLYPLAMGHAEYLVTVREKRGHQ